MEHEQDRIYASLKERIVLLDYEPGQVLREKALIDEFGVSRTPVREALIRLECEGLVRIIPNSGTIVTEVGFQNLKDVFELRAHLVRLAARLAVARATEEDLAALEGLIAQMREAGDPKALMRLDSAFHDRFNRATRNEVLVRTLEMLRNQAVRIWTYSQQDAYYEDLSTEFGALLKALKARDEEETARILEDHTRRFIEHIRAQLTW